MEPEMESEMEIGRQRCWRQRERNGHGDRDGDRDDAAFSSL